jgi:photosystem II stability/assembly factor-like uncharacterized protein
MGNPRHYEMVTGKNIHRSLWVAISLLSGFHSALAQSWVLTSAPNGSWTALASSADGAKLIAAQYGGIFISTNSGSTWGQVTNLTDGNWLSVASSADGTKLVANTGNANKVYRSTDSGATWALLPIGGFPVTSTADGNTLIVAASGEAYSTGAIHISNDAGATWKQATNAPNLGWYAVRCSADGTVVAALAHGSGVYLSMDSGTHWTLSQSVGLATPPFLVVGAIAMSAEGSNIIAAAAGRVYASTNMGANWFTNNVPQGNSMSVAISGDGTKCLAAIQNGPIYTSTDSGASWVSNSAPVKTWFGACSSSDGSKLVAAAYGDGIYSWQYAPMLRLTPSDTNIVVSWPDSTYTNVFVLQQNADLSTANWTDVPLPVADDGTNKSVTLTLPANNIFFRLKQ